MSSFTGFRGSRGLGFVAWVLRVPKGLKVFLL